MLSKLLMNLKDAIIDEDNKAIKKAYYALSLLGMDNMTAKILVDEIVDESLGIAKRNINNRI